MKVLSSKAHGILDYLVGISLIAFPIMAGYITNSPEYIILITMGIILLIYSLLTNYEFGLLRVLPYKMHLTLDILSAFFIGASPWIFGFADRVYSAFVIIAICEIIAVSISERETSCSNHNRHRKHVRV